MVQTWNSPSWLVLLSASLALTATEIFGADPQVADRAREKPRSQAAEAAARVPLDRIPQTFREGVHLVIAEPTLFVRGPLEVFRGKPALYYWFLDHPDRATVIWRRLGAKCVKITDRGGGRFGCVDELGSDISWQTVHRDAHQRIWYAEGIARPAPLFPLVPIRAVVVLHFSEEQESPSRLGRPLLRHQADVYLQTDSKTAQLAAKLLGPSAPRVARQSVTQMEMFFSLLVWYFDQHPDRTWMLLASTKEGVGSRE